MKTVTVDKYNLEGAAKCLKDGGLVVFPTETVYGLGADFVQKYVFKGICYSILSALIGVYYAYFQCVHKFV